MSTVYLNGAYLPIEEAAVSVLDRGFLLSDGVYEVTPFYEGVPFCLDRHLERLRRSLHWLRIELDPAGLEEVFRRLVALNGLDSVERSLVYLQVTRGVAPRTHYFPESPVAPTVYAHTQVWQRPPEERWSRGFRAITAPDLRWGRVDIKSVSLLPNVLAFQAARDAGADDVILVREGVAIEGAHQNFWAVIDGAAVTHPTTNHILAGITRGVVIELAGSLGIPVVERPIFVEELPGADELFFTGTTGEVRPCVEVDGTPIGEGRAGPVTRALSDGFLARVAGTKEAASAAAR